jgi:hypothetical protein
MIENIRACFRHLTIRSDGRLKQGRTFEDPQGGNGLSS